MVELGEVIGIALKTRTRGAMRTISRVTLHANLGLDGVVTKKGYRQVTLLSAEAWAQVVAEIGADLPWYARRANLLTRGIDLLGLIGRRIRIGPAEVEVLDELDPCARMEEIHAGLYEALLRDGRGGVFGRICCNGTVRVGDRVSLVQAEQNRIARENPRPGVQ